MLIQPIRDWGEALMAALAAALIVFFTSLPRIIGFLAIILIGWFVAYLLAKAIAALLRSMRFDDLAQRAGLSGFVAHMGLRANIVEVFAEMIQWFVRLITLVVAFDTLGLPAVSQVLQQFLNQMVRAGQVELVREEAESVTYRLPEQQASRRA